MRRVALVALLLGGCRINIDTPVDEMTTTDASSCVKGTSGLCQCVMGTSAACMAAPTSGNTFTWINENILNNNCLGSSCHQANSSSNAKKNPYGDAATSYASLVNFVSNVKPNTVPPTVLVVPNQPKQSYALVMLNKLPAEDFLPATVGYPAADIGLMPQSNNTLCCQKLDAIEAWITAGAPMVP